MSYCVNCGVELDDSAKKCALCDTPVINPNKPNSADAETESPFGQIMHVPKQVKKRFVALVITLVMLIPCIVCFFVNAFVFKGSFWSVYVVATTFLLWILFVLPFFIKNYRAYFMWAFDTLAVSLYVYVFYVMGKGLDKWYTNCALPIILVNAFLVLAYLIWVRFKKRNSILKALVIFAEIAVTSFVTGLLLSVGTPWPYMAEIGFTLALCILAVVGFLTYCYFSKSMRKWLSERLFT